jgi:ABC-2 type transport system permease protein
MTAALACYAQSVRESQHSATLPVLVAAPTSASRLIVLSSAYPMLRATIEAALFLTVGAALGLGFQAANVPAAVLVFLLSLAAFSAVGILSAACIVVWKRGDPIPWLVGAASWLFGGVFFPIDRLPEPLQVLSRALPIAHALEAFRPALLDGPSFGAVLAEAAPLVAFTVAAVPLSLWLFSRAIERARAEGTLRQY